MNAVIPIDPKVREALAALDAAPDDVASVLGCWRSPDGQLGDPVTREEWRSGLLAGDVDPAGLLRTIRLLGFVNSPEFDALVAARTSAGSPGRTSVSTLVDIPAAQDVNPGHPSP